MTIDPKVVAILAVGAAAAGYIAYYYGSPSNPPIPPTPIPPGPTPKPGPVPPGQVIVYGNQVLTLPGGENSYIVCGKDKFSAGAVEYTIEIDFKTKMPETWHLFSCNVPTKLTKDMFESSYLLAYVQPTNVVFLQGGYVSMMIRDPIMTNDNKWHKVVIVHKGPTHWELWFDGTKRDEMETTPGIVAQTVSSEFYVCGRPSGSEFMQDLVNLKGCVRGINVNGYGRTPFNAPDTIEQGCAN